MVNTAEAIWWPCSKHEGRISMLREVKGEDGWSQSQVVRYLFLPFDACKWKKRHFCLCSCLFYVPSTFELYTIPIWPLYLRIKMKVHSCHLPQERWCCLGEIILQNCGGGTFRVHTSAVSLAVSLRRHQFCFCCFCFFTWKHCFFLFSVLGAKKVFPQTPQVQW